MPFDPAPLAAPVANAAPLLPARPAAGFDAVSEFLRPGSDVLSIMRAMLHSGGGQAVASSPAPGTPFPPSLSDPGFPSLGTAPSTANPMAFGPPSSAVTVPNPAYASYFGTPATTNASGSPDDRQLANGPPVYAGSMMPGAPQTAPSQNPDLSPRGDALDYASMFPMGMPPLGPPPPLPPGYEVPDYEGAYRDFLNRQQLGQDLLNREPPPLPTGDLLRRLMGL